MKDKIEIKNIKIYLSITVSLILISLTAVAYAIFASNDEVSNDIRFHVETNGESYALSGSTDGSIEFSVSSYDLSEDRVSNTAVASDDGKLYVKLSSPSEDVTTRCQYDIVWVWESTDRYTEPSGFLGDVYQDADGNSCGEYNSSTCNGSLIGNFPYEFSVQIDDDVLVEKDLSELKLIDENKVLIASDVSITTNNATEEGVTKTHNITMNIYNIPYNQRSIVGRNFKGHFAIENINCFMYEGNQGLLSNLVLNEGEHTSITDGSLYRLHEESFRASDLNDAVVGYRYEGANPDNYVLYNDELWRIIGFEPGYQIGLDVNEDEEIYYAKIIRGLSLGDYDWDENGVNNWADSTLNNILNTDYLYQENDFIDNTNFPNQEAVLNNEKGLSTEARKMIAKNSLGQYSTWHLRGAAAYSTYTSKNFFESERFTGNTGNNGAGPATISAAVGLIYPSDYGFALYQNSTSTTCNNTSTKLYQGGYDSCEQYNWLFDGNESWFISSYGNNATQAFRLRSAGSVSIGTVNDTARDIRPVVYLNSNVEIFKGDGSLNNPYIIGQKEKTYYYAFGNYAVNEYPTTTVDYTELNKIIFIRDDTPSEINREVCMIMDEQLHCFKSNNYEAEKEHAKQLFGEANCLMTDGIVSSYWCNNNVFTCDIYTNGNVQCRKESSNEYCHVNFDGSTVCSN